MSFERNLELDSVLLGWLPIALPVITDLCTTVCVLSASHLPCGLDETSLNSPPVNPR